MSGPLPWIADALVVLGALMMSVSVYGMVRIRDDFVRLHLSNLIIPGGVLPIALAAGLAQVTESLGRAILLSTFLLLTGPVAAQAIAYALRARQTGEDGERNE